MGASRLQDADSISDVSDENFGADPQSLQNRESGINTDQVDLHLFLAREPESVRRNELHYMYLNSTGGG